MSTTYTDVTLGTAPAINPLKAELNPICHLLALLGAHPILHVSRIRVKQSMTLTVAAAVGQLSHTV